MNPQQTDSSQPQIISPQAASAVAPPTVGRQLIAPAAAPPGAAQQPMASPAAAPAYSATSSVAPSASDASLSASPQPAVSPDRPYQLATPAPLRPAITLGLGLPAQVSGLPAFYYWKDAILVGSYVHPTRRFALHVTREKLDALVKTFGRMRANGVGVPILMDHTPSAAATLGWIVDVRRRGDRLLELHQFLGESARDTGLRNFVSLGIDPDFVDGRGVRYGEAIVHSAVTPTPVVPGQAAFEPASGDGESAEARTLTLGLAEARTAGAADLPAELAPGEDQPPAREEPACAEEPQELEEAAAAAGPPVAVADSVAIAAPDLGIVAPAEPAAAAVEPPAAPAMQLALAALADAAAAKRDLAIARGGVAPAVADELFALLVRSAEGVLNVMALSRDAANGVAGSAAPLALAVFDALARNQPVALGEETSLQALTRLIPGEDDERAELRERMIALASARR